MKKGFALIAAVDSKMGIGKNGRLPWKLPADMKFFHDTTTGEGRNSVIMGRTTWESIPKAHRPLQKRLNIVLSRHALELPQGVLHATDLEKALELAARASRGTHLGSAAEHAGEIFVIGGAKVFHETIAHPLCHTIYLTKVFGEFGCDTFFPKIQENHFKETYTGPLQHDNGIEFQFCTFARSMA